MLHLPLQERGTVYLVRMETRLTFLSYPSGSGCFDVSHSSGLVFPPVRVSTTYIGREQEDKAADDWSIDCEWFRIDLPDELYEEISRSCFEAQDFVSPPTALFSPEKS